MVQYSASHVGAQQVSPSHGEPVNTQAAGPTPTDAQSVRSGFSQRISIFIKFSGDADAVFPGTYFLVQIMLQTPLNLFGSDTVESVICES